MTKQFKFVTDEPLPHQTIPTKKVKGKQTAFNTMDELDIDPDDEREEELFTISSDLYDYGSIQFKSISALESYVSQKGFDCKIVRNGKPWGYWSSLEGIIKF